MDDRKTYEIASDLDDLIVDVEELKQDGDPETGEKLEETQAALERAREVLDDAGDTKP